MRLPFVFLAMAATLLASGDAVTAAAALNKPISGTSIAVDSLGEGTHVEDKQRLLRVNKVAEEDNEEEERAIPWLTKIMEFFTKLQTKSQISKTVSKWLKSSMTPSRLFQELNLANVPRTDIKWRQYSKFITGFKERHPNRYSTGFKIKPRLVINN